MTTLHLEVYSYHSCNNGRIQGFVVRVENDSISPINYTSQLEVTLTSDLINKNIECVLDNGISETVVGSAIITAGKPDILFHWCENKMFYNISITRLLFHYY